LESLLPSFSDLGSLSVIILLSAAGLYYFGKLILDVKVEQQEQTSAYYTTGLMFALGNVALPFIIVWAITGYFNVSLSILPNVIVQLIVLSILTYGLILNTGRYTLFSRFKDAYKFQIDIEKNDNKLVKFADNRMGENLVAKSMKLQEKISNIITNNYTVLILSLIVSWTIFPSAKSVTLISPESVLLYILTFLNFTLLALIFGYIGIYHPPATIVLDNGERIAGRIVKIGKFVNLINEADGKKFFINSSKIIYVEESMFKEKFNEALRLAKEKSSSQPTQKENEPTGKEQIDGNSLSEGI
jgi:hypothetical protein